MNCLDRMMPKRSIKRTQIDTVRYDMTRQRRTLFDQPYSLQELARTDHSHFVTIVGTIN